MHVARATNLLPSRYGPLGDAPTVCIFGGGLSGLTAALKIRAALRDVDVVVVEKPIPESNTQLSGMRLRMGIPHQRRDPKREIVELLARRNDGQVTASMRLFADVAVAELAYWQDRSDFVAHHDQPQWFGPQWGRANRAGSGRGRSVLDWLRLAAAEAGVRFLPAVLRRLVVTGDRVASALVELHHAEGAAPVVLEAAGYVVANGSATGLLFSSTNKRIHWSGHEVAFHSGLELEGSTLHMVHPFGNSGADGRSRVGCLETDLLAASTVRVTDHDGDTSVDEYTTRLLARHEAHDHFPELARRLSFYRQPLRLADEHGRTTFASVAQHYHHLGIRTTDGLRIAGLCNAFAVGDAAGIGFWTNHRERQPGFALLKCLVDAALLAKAMVDAAPGEHGRIRPPRAVELPSLNARTAREATVRLLAPLNTRHLFALLRQERASERLAIAGRWAGELRALIGTYGPTSLSLISVAMAEAHAAVARGTAAEPIGIDRDSALATCAPSRRDMNPGAQAATG